LIDILMRDKRENPSNYCLFVMSEGAEWEGYRLREYGEADAYGHRKKANVAEDLSDVIKKHTGEETVVSDLTYDLRSGGPDFTDRLVATTFGTIALDAAREGKSGLMTAIVNGSYGLVEIPDPKLGPRKMDVETMYNKERLRPNYSNKVGLPIFLTRT
jgi:ATP-dependent phosphofructokinase / diphosphate-dependent phosphofructokinase